MLNRDGEDDLSCVNVGRVCCPHSNTIAPFLQLAERSHSITNVPNTPNNLLRLTGGADNNSVNPIQASKPDFRCHRCNKTLKNGSVPAHINNCAQYAESFFIEGEGLTETLTYLKIHCNGKWMCTKGNNVVAKTKTCVCGKSRPDNNIHIHEDYPLSHLRDEAQVILPEQADLPYYFDPYNETEDFNLKMRQNEAQTLESVPYKSRKKFGKTMTSLLTEVNRDPLNKSAHARLLAFPKVVLSIPAPERNSSKAKKATAKTVSENINMWIESDRGKKILLERLFNRDPQDFRSRSKNGNITETNVKRAKKLYRQLRFSDAANALTSEGTVEWSPEVLQKVTDKHPRADRPEIPEGAVPPALQVNEEAVVKALNSFPKGTGCGRDGLRAQHLLDACNWSAPMEKEYLLKSITTFVNNMLKANSPKELAKFYASAPIVPLAKENGDVRPIAIGEIWRRLVGKCGAEYIKPTLGQLFAPLQLATGIKSGGQAIPHAVRELADQFGDNDEMVLLKIDGLNAFQMTHREVTFRAIRKYCPEISAVVEHWYGNKPPLLFCGDSYITSESGSQQGCPFGGIMFAITIYEMLLEIKTECPDLLLNAWFYDDSNLCGKIGDVQKAYEIIKAMGPTVGFYPTDRKSILWWPQMDLESLSIFPPEMTRVTEGGTDVMKSPIGSPQYCEDFMMKKVGRIKDTIDMIVKHLGDEPLMQIQLLQYCVGTPQIGYYLQTTPPALIENATAHFDSCMHDALQSILGTGLSTNQRIELSLPRSKGGLQLPKASDIAASAYLGSKARTLSLCNQMRDRSSDFIPQCFTQELERFNLENDKDITSQFLIASLKQQWYLSQIVQERNRVKIFNEACNTDKARLNSLANVYSAAWTAMVGTLNSCPSFTAAQIRLLLVFRIGKEVYAREGACNQCTGKMSDRLGHHDATCPGGNRTKGRHDKLRDELAKISREAGFMPQIEVKDILDDTGEKPADVLLPDYTNGRPCCFDTVVSSPYTDPQNSAQQIGYAINKAEAAKCEKYQQRCNDKGYDFSPFAMDIYGGMGRSCYALLARLALGIADKTNQTVGLVKGKIIQRLVAVVQKGVVLALQSRFDI